MEMHQTDKAPVARWLGAPAFTPPGGMARHDLAQRISNWLDELAASPADLIAGITDASVILTATLHILSTPMEAIWQLDIAPEHHRFTP
jgi:broad specificity phosphatase PhoE